MPRAILRLVSIRRFPNVADAEPVDAPLVVPAIAQVEVSPEELDAIRAGQSVVLTFVATLQSAV